MPTGRRRDHRDLEIWRDAIDFAVRVYTDTAEFPRNEQFGLTTRLRRAATSVANNIAEGAARATTREFIHFLHISRGSLAEIETSMLIAQ